MMQPLIRVSRFDATSDCDNCAVANIGGKMKPTGVERAAHPSTVKLERR